MRARVRDVDIAATVLLSWSRVPANIARKSRRARGLGSRFAPSSRAAPWPVLWPRIAVFLGLAYARAVHSCSRNQYRALMRAPQEVSVEYYEYESGTQQTFAAERNTRGRCSDQPPAEPVTATISQTGRSATS